MQGPALECRDDHRGDWDRDRDRWEHHRRDRERWERERRERERRDHERRPHIIIIIERW
jgi:hypothetical protein